MGIEQSFIDRHPGSSTLYARASKVLPSGVTHDSRFMRPFPVYIDHAAGAYKWDVDGQRYIDYVVGHGALLLGQSHPVVLEAASAQLARGTHYGGSHELEIAWAEEVVRIVPSAEVVRFTSSGTEATLMALRLARAFTGKPGIIKFHKHFHGWHDYVAANSKYGDNSPPGIPESTLDSVAVLPLDLGMVGATVEERGDIGAVIIESAGASSGQLPVPRGFLQALQAFCNERGIIFIMDEVVTGFRWAPGGVQEAEDVKPDLTTLAKILAGGFPGGAVAGRRDIMQGLAFPDVTAKGQKIGHPGTFNANPLSAAAGIACLRTIADGSHQRRATQLAAQLRAGMNGVLCSRGVQGVIYGQSSAFRVLIGGPTVPEEADYDPRDLDWDVLAAGGNPERERLLQLALLNRGVQLFGTGGMLSSVHTEDDIAISVEAFDGAIGALQDEGVL
ncbi:MAG TPA: aminotransferase class III-fold pyridoxal phosphate-dependent enzyme [Tepidiformaceae bacterium]|nr:aminotransferase class III-fold pyridoxal phosphate-dependent enzyme [Tepidiformaceae bacterium]